MAPKIKDQHVLGKKNMTLLLLQNEKYGFYSRIISEEHAEALYLNRSRGICL